jgi:predicted TIM-barrel fold metal-dependent hydrolase
MGISRLICFMGFPWSYDPDPQEIRQQNDQVMRVVEHGQPRLMGFAYLNPRYVAESLAELERCVRDGPLVGIKLWVARRCHEPEIDPIIEKAALCHAAIFQHTWFKAEGNRPGESTPDDLAELAERHPQASLICGHAGGDWELGIRSIRKHRNVSIELGGFDPTAGVVEMAMRELGPDRILYGSDVAGRSFASQLGKVLGAEISVNAKRQILAGNLQSLLRPILESKGQLE